MSDSAHFRMRANQCRNLANGARDEASRRELNDLAEQLDDEARIIEAEEEASRNTKQ